MKFAHIFRFSSLTIVTLVGITLGMPKIKTVSINHGDRPGPHPLQKSVLLAPKLLTRIKLVAAPANNLVPTAPTLNTKADSGISSIPSDGTVDRVNPPPPLFPLYMCFCSARKLTSHSQKQYAFIICGTTRSQHQHQAYTKRIDEGLQYLYDVVEFRNPGPSITITAPVLVALVVRGTREFLLLTLFVFITHSPFFPFPLLPFSSAKGLK